MKSLDIVSYTPESFNVPKLDDGPVIRVSDKKIRLNPAAIRTLRVTPGAKVVFSQSKADPRKWYLHKATEGFQLCKEKTVMSINSTGLSRLLINTFNHEKSGPLRIEIAESPLVMEGVSYFLLRATGQVVDADPAGASEDDAGEAGTEPQTTARKRGRPRKGESEEPVGFFEHDPKLQTI